MAELLFKLTDKGQKVYKEFECNYSTQPTLKDLNALSNISSMELKKAIISYDKVTKDMNPDVPSIMTCIAVLEDENKISRDSEDTLNRYGIVATEIVSVFEELIGPMIADGLNDTFVNDDEDMEDDETDFDISETPSILNSSLLRDIKDCIVDCLQEFDGNNVE